MTSTPNEPTGPNITEQTQAIRSQQRTEQRAAMMDTRLTDTERQSQLSQIDARADAQVAALTKPPAPEPKVKHDVRSPSEDRRAAQQRLATSGFTDPRSTTERDRDDNSKRFSDNIRDTKREQDEARTAAVEERRRQGRIRQHGVDPQEHAAALERAQQAEDAAKEPLRLATAKVTALMNVGYAPDEAARLASLLDGITDPEKLPENAQLIRTTQEAVAVHQQAFGIAEAIRSGRARLVWNVGTRQGQPVDMNRMLHELARQSRRPTLTQRGLQQPGDG